MLALSILILSIICQSLAAWFALRHMRHFEARSAWLWISAGFALMAVHRIVCFVDHLAGTESHLNESLASLLISASLLVGVLRLGPLFDEVFSAFRKVHRSEKYYRLLHEGMLDGSVFADQQGRCLDSNSAFQAMVGYSGEELRRLSYEDITPDKYQDFEENVVLKQLRERGYSDLFEKEFIRKDGTRIPAEMRVYLLKDEETGEKKTWALIRDISVRREFFRALQESESRFTVFMNHFPGEILIKDDACRIVYANRFFEEVLGHDEWREKTASELFPGEMGERLLEKDRHVLDQGELKSQEERLDRLGHKRLLECHRFPVRIDGGSMLIGSIGLEVTDMARAEQERAAFARLGLELSEAGTPLAMAQALSRAAEVLFRWDAFYFAERVPGTNRFRSLYAVDHVDGKRIVDEQAMRRSVDYEYPASDSLLQGKPLMINRREGEAEDGAFSRFGDVTRPSLSLLFMPILLRGEVYGVLSIQSYQENRYDENDLDLLRNLADEAAPSVRRTLVEDELRASEERLRALIDATPDLIVFKDGLGRWLVSNEKTLDTIGLKEKDYQGKTDAELIDLSPEFREYFERCLAEDEKAWESGEPYRNDLSVPSKEGKAIIYDTFRIPLLYEDGRRKGLVLIGRDITERKQAQEERHKLELQVQQAQKLESLGVLAGGIAHDFNNLLVAILGHAGLALDEVASESPARPSLYEIEHAAKRAADLCRQMLAYSGRGRFLIEPVNLNRIIEEMTELLSVSITKRASLKYNLAEELPLIEADVTQIRQVVMNLITNASEAIGDEKSGIISLTTGSMNCDREYLESASYHEDLKEGRYVYLEISDTGQGMDSETREKIFDPFFTTKSTGRGLGMAAVLGIVRSHNGAIRIYTEKGRGSSFKILMPALEAGAEASASAGKRTEETPGGDGNVILVVDDEPSVRLLTEKVLERAGFRVVTAASGEEGLELFREHQDEVICVLLDLTMPGISGEETFREIRRIRKDTRVVLMSGYSEEEVGQRFTGKGLAGFIQKPYQRPDLLAKIHGALKKG